MLVEDKNILWLDLFAFLSYSKKVKLLKLFDGKDIMLSFLSCKGIYDILTEEEIAKMANFLDENKFYDLIDSFINNGIEFITINNPNYPNQLKEISMPPFCLYCKGNIQLLNTFCVGIVGSRKSSEYGLLVTKQYAKAFVENDLTVVSGLASGVDTIAHKTALENNGKTIAVLAGGLNHIYPASNYYLAKQMCENNLILSENNPNIEPSAYLFPIRNRIIAGLSNAVLITEAGEKSGSLHTANYAIEFNKVLFAVPGRINADLSKGTNKLIKDNMAKITLEPEDVFDALNLNNKEKVKNSTIQLDFKQQIVLDYIKAEKKTFQEILDFSKLSTAELNALLLELEMEGLLLKLPNNSYIMA